MAFEIAVGTARAQCESNQTILDAVLRHGAWVPNSCNQGTCGTCKLKLTDGSVEQPGIPDSVLSSAEQEQGYVLACQSSPRSNVVLEPPADEGGPRHVLRDITGTVGSITEVAVDTLKISVDLTEPLEFSAGQYVEVAIPGTGEVRQYSMANAPSAPEVLELHVRRQPGGLATDRWMFDGLAVGDSIDMTGPWGDFCFDCDDTDSGLILLAGGTGLAPLTSMVRHALSVDPGREIHLYHGVRTADDLYEVEFWEALAAEYAGVRYVPCLSRQSWSGRTGYVGDAVAEDFPSCKSYAGYLCGPPAMVDAGVKALKRRRMAPRRIKREKYTPAGGGILAPA